MTFDPKDMEVRTLFKTFDTFKIPVFQRDYSWDKPYYSKFLEDIISRLEIKDRKVVTTPYFIGTMVIVGKRNGGVVDVVDGQQRITVITILFSALSKLFLDIDEETLSNTTFKYIKEEDDNGQFQRQLISDTSYPYFEYFIQSKEKKYNETPKSDEEENIKNTYDYFISELSETKIKRNFDEEIEYREVLKAIRDQVLSSLLVCIRTPDVPSAYMIFEILNAKGKNLASIDLIKNVIFETLHNDKNGATARADGLWNDTKSKLRERNNSIGLGTFYRHFWISKYQKVNSNKLYDSFKSHIKPKTVDNYIDFLDEIYKEADLYIKIISPLLSDYSDRKEYAWLVQSLKSISRTFGNIQSRIALLALLDAKNRDVITMKTFKDAIQYIENFVFSYIVIGSQRANIFESAFSKFAIKLRHSNGKAESNDIIKEYLYQVLDSKYISYDIFEKNFIELKFSKKDHPRNVYTKYVLNKISSYYDEKDIFDTSASIEHIMPEDDENSLNIGNLICLEEDLNNDADDLPYEEKKEIYDNSKFEQVKIFVKEYPEFSEKDFKARAKDLSAFYFIKILKRSIGTNK